ncbi:MAG: DUF3501 family protein [Acidobacteriota bacterium]|nr:DUF3501 family protein [Acidobacteriota bacterium]
MRPVLRHEIVDYQTYEEDRDQTRASALEIKQPRRIHVGSYLTFLFENRDTVRYQVQEMMRTEQIVKEADILHELDTYNELLGKTGELGCTLLIEIESEQERAEKLTQWLPVPEHLYAKLPDGSKVRAKYDARQVGETRLSSVQYLKFDVGGETPVALGCDFDLLNVEAELTLLQKAALGEDLADD